MLGIQITAKNGNDFGTGEADHCGNNVWVQPGLGPFKLKCSIYTLH